MEMTISILAAVGVAAIVLGVFLLGRTFVRALQAIESLYNRWEYLSERQDTIRERYYKLDERVDNIEDLIAKEAVKTLKK